MAAVKNSLDKILQAATTRTINAPNAAVLLSASTNAFHINNAGANDPASITFTGSRIAIEGVISFVCTGGTLTVSGDVATLTYANMSAATASVTASITANGVTITSNACAVTKVLDGAAGSNGMSNVRVFAYQRSASAPTGTPGAVDVDLTTGTITTATLANGWQKAIPTANGNPLYVTVATASSSGTTDNIASTEWSSAVILAQDGPGGTGTNGLNTATAYIYQRGATSTAPALPSVAATYNFGATSPLTGLNNGWSATVPSTGGAYLFVSTATASSVSGSDSIPAIEWAAVQLLAQDGAQGSSGTSVFVGKIYLQNATLPSTPTGGTFNFGTATLTPPSGWSATQPTSSTTPTWVAQYTFSTSTAGATVTAATWSTPVAVAQNGANGSSGVQSGAAIVYQWAATIPSGPAGAATYTWSSGAFGSAPTGWALTPGTSPSPGFTLWQARVGVNDSAANATTAFNWTSAAITAVGYAGQQGSSYVTAYCDSTTATTTTTPASTAGPTSVPAVNGGGVTGTWQSTVPTSLASGHYMWQSDGIYNPATNQISWSIPYWSYAKFGSLSAITANLGQITAGSIDLGTGATSWHVDTAGNEWAGASTYGAAPYRRNASGDVVARSLVIQSAIGDTVLDGAGLKPGYEAPGTKNSDITNSIYSGSILSPDKKPAIVREWADIQGEVSALYGQGGAFGVIAERNAYSASYDQLEAYLAGLTGWNVIPGADVAIIGTQLSDRFGDYYHSRLVLLNAINIKAKTLANAAQNAADTANTAINDPTTGLAQRLRANAVNVLSGGGAVTIGSLTVDSSGNRTGGNGVGITGKGIAAYAPSGAASFILDATTGDASFGGTLTAANMVATDNMVSNSISATDIFSSGISTSLFPGSSFVVTRTSKVLVIAKFSADGSGFYVTDSAGSTIMQQLSGNSGENGVAALTLAAGTYKLLTYAGSTSFAYILKVMV